MASADTRGLWMTNLMLGFLSAVFIGAALEALPLLAFGGLVGYLAAMVHGVQFCVLAFRRRRPWQLQPLERVIHRSTLAMLVLAVAVNLSLVIRYVNVAQVTAVVGWSVTILVLSYRAWVVPSPLRAAVLQVVSVVLAIPSIFVQQVAWSAGQRTVGGLDDAAVNAIDTSLLVYLIVIAATGPVLHRLFGSRPDPVDDAVPRAIVHADRWDPMTGGYDRR